MRKRIFKHLFSTLFLIAFYASCQQEATRHPLLLKADTLMIDHPDSALAVLQSIHQPAGMNRADRALYALLMTRAEDKNEIPITSDSLIQTAVSYYQDGKDPYRKAQSLYYLACAYEDMNKIAPSLNTLLKIEEILKAKYPHDRLMYLVNSNLANQYRKQGFYEKAMVAGKKSYDNSVMRNDSADILYAIDYIASIYLSLDKNDSASVYYAKGLEMAEIRRDSSWIASFLGDISEIDYNLKDYQRALKDITKAIAYEPDGENLLYYYCLKGDILHEMGERDSAMYYLSKSAHSDDINVQYLSNLTLSAIEKRAGNFEKSLEHSEAATALIDSIYKIDKQTEIFKILNDHAITAHTKAITYKERRKTRRIIIFAVCVLVTLTFVYLSVDKHRKNQIIKLQKQLMRNRAQMLKANQQKEDNGTAESESELNTYRDICIKNIQTGGKLFRQYAIYKEIHAIDKLQHKETSIPSKKRNQLKESVYETFPDALLSLRDLYNLTPDDAYCCILFSLNLSNRTVAACMGVAEGAIKTRKSRIKIKLGKEIYNHTFHSN